jgi:DNA-directed RNA polymerase subunit H (RpoH/RPB5)
MQTFALVCSISLLLALGFSPQRETPRRTINDEAAQRTPALRQLAAVRGEIIKVTRPVKGMLSITVRPAKEFQEVTVLARENDLVGSAVGRSGESDLLGLLSDDSHDDETITAAELNEGDVVSVIYDPARQNKALEIYLR